MRAGRLSRRVTIQERVETQNATGEVVWTWQDVACVWAEIAAVNGREFFSAQQIQSNVTHTILIRWRRGIVAKMRVVEDGGSCGDTVYYDIEAPLANARRTELRLMCVTRDADGWRG